MVSKAREAIRILQLLKYRDRRRVNLISVQEYWRGRDTLHSRNARQRTFQDPPAIFGDRLSSKGKSPGPPEAGGHRKRVVGSSSEQEAGELGRRQL